MRIILNISIKIFFGSSFLVFQFINNILKLFDIFELNIINIYKFTNYIIVNTSVLKTDPDPRLNR